MYTAVSKHVGNLVRVCGEYVGGILQQLNGNAST